jgi:hypothetical protein
MASMASMSVPKLLFNPAVLVALTVIWFQSVTTSATAGIAATDKIAAANNFVEEFEEYVFVCLILLLGCLLWFPQELAGFRLGLESA